MNTASERLASARARAGYDTAKDAAEAMGIAVPTYIQHENGTRGITTAKATRYARFFRTTPEWILYGRGSTDPDEPSIGDLEEMVRLALSEMVTLDTKLSDLPHIIAPNLFKQLERFRADRAKRH